MYVHPLGNKKGFTVLELVIVMSVLAVLTVTYFNWPGYGINLGLQAIQLRSDIQYIQFIAMSRNEKTRINFSSNQYTLTLANGTTAVNLPGSNTNIISLETGLTATYSNSSIYFNGEGVPYTSTSAELASNATVTLSAQGQSKVVTIAPETGHVSIS